MFIHGGYVFGVWRPGAMRAQWLFRPRSGIRQRVARTHVAAVALTGEANGTPPVVGVAAVAQVAARAQKGTKNSRRGRPLPEGADGFDAVPPPLRSRCAMGFLTQ